MKAPTLNAVLVLLMLTGAVSLTGCALMGEAALLEGTLGRAALRTAARSELGLLGRSGLRLAGSEVVIADAGAFRTAMSGIRVQRSLLGRPQLVARGESSAFAEVVNSRTLRLLKTNQQITLPGTLNVVKGNKVNVRAGPGLNYDAFKQVKSDQIVLVETCESGWCKVQLADEVGWIAAALLAAVVAKEQDQQR